MSDAAYMEAVERGDMKTAQRMVDEAAKKAGYKTNVGGFFVQNANESIGKLPTWADEIYKFGKLASENGRFETVKQYHRAASYGDAIEPKRNSVIESALRYWDGSDGTLANYIFEQGLKGEEIGPFVFAERIGNAPKLGYSLNYRDQTGEKGVSVLGLLDPSKGLVKQNDGTFELFNDGERKFVGGFLTPFKGSDGEPLLIGIQFDGKRHQIKSADPITRDDSGSVIPLSQRFNNQSEDIRNPRQLMGININDCTQDFTGQILRGEKTIETRSTRSLDPYIGERVGLVRTGVGKATLVGYATVGEPVVYDSVAKFRRDYDKHLVAPGSAFDMKDRLKYGYQMMQVEGVTPREVQSKGIVARRVNPYTKPDLRERLKRKVIAGSKGGNPGQWSAKKAQLLAAEYEKAGGGYTGERSASQRSLSKWSKQDWRTKSGKPSLKTGERYLPAKAIKALSAAEYAATTRAKRKATGQFSRQPKRIAMKTKEFRNPMDPRSMVDEAARAAGYTTKAFHRTSSKFTKFIPGGPNATRQIWRTKSGESRTLFGQSGRAMWFGTSPDNLPAYHNEPTGKGVVLTVYLKNPNPLQIDDDTRDWARDLYGDGSREFPLLLSDEHIKSIRDDGYTGIEYWQKGKTAEKSSPDEIVVFDANQIKSADLVTYDDAGNSIPISNRFSGKSDDIRNPVTPSIRKKLASVIESDDRILCYDTAADEDFYRLWDIIHTDLTLNKESLMEIEGMLDDDGVLVIESGESPAGLQDHFRKTTRYQGLLLVQGPLNPEQARIETEKLRRDLE